MTKVPAILVTRGVKLGEVKWSTHGHLVMLGCNCFSSLSGFLESASLAALPGPVPLLTGAGFGANVLIMSADCPRVWPHQV